MKRFFATVLLVLASSHAAADWVSVGELDKAEVFVDPASVERSGTTVKMWSLYQLRTPGSANGVAYQSLKRQDEYDCKQPRARGVAIAAYAGEKATGKVVVSESTVQPWAPVTPQGTIETLWNIACEKK